jgi:hypothetical protein
MLHATAAPIAMQLAQAERCLARRDINPKRGNGMLAQSVKQKFVLLEIVAACAVLAACGGGGGDAGMAGDQQTEAAVVATAGTDPATDGTVGAAAAATPDATQGGADAVAAPQASAAAPADSSEQAAAAADPADLAPAAGEPAWGSMEATSESYGDSAATEEPVLRESGPSEETAVDAANQTSDGTDGSGRESAQSLSVDSSDSGYAKPRVAALDYSSDSSSTKAAQLAKYKFVILAGRSASAIASLSSSIHSRRSSAQIAAYTVFNELDCSVSSTSSKYPLVKAANSTNWWLRKASGSRSQWSGAYNHCDMNISSWQRRDSSGRTWQQYKPKFDYDKLFRIAPYVNWAFADNTFHKPRVDADWRRIGTNQLRTDSTIVSAQRAGQAAYWSALRSRKSSLKIVGNVDGDLSPSQYVDKLNGGFMEGAMGRSYSLETWAGWGTMMTRYRAIARNTASPSAAFLQVYGGATNFKQMRYGLASALMENGYYVYLPSSGTLKSAWYDEYDAPLGTPTESPPTAPKQNGIWLRHYQNGIVLVNPSKTSTRSIYVGTGYRRLKGTQNPSVNSGVAQSTVTLAPRSGLIMIRR